VATVEITSPKNITLTPSGAQHVKKMLEKNHAAFLSFGVKDSGCNAKKYFIDFVREKSNDDKTFLSHGIEILVNKHDLLYLAGTEIDYVTEGLNKMLRYNNPNVKSACGCGESFDIE
jgi:iron-sulfur cluster assembly protein